jgi:hypothetical protein
MIRLKMRRDRSFDENPSRFDIFSRKNSNIPRFLAKFFLNFHCVDSNSYGLWQTADVVLSLKLLDTGEIQHWCLWDRLGDDGGGAWNTPVIVMMTGTVGGYFDMSVVQAVRD